MAQLNKNVNLIGPINPTGYGVHFTNLVYSLLGILSDYSNVRILNIGGVPNHPWLKLKECEKKLHNKPKDITIKLWHDNDLVLDNNTYNIAYTVFELDRFERPTQIADPRINEIWVATQWAKTIVEKHLGDNKKPVFVVPEGVCSASFPFDQYRIKRDEAEHLFYQYSGAISIGKFEKRKGHELLLDIWRYIDVPLTCLWHNPFIKKEDIIKRIAHYGWIVGNTIKKHLGVGATFYQFWHKNGYTPITVCLDFLEKHDYQHLISQQQFGVFPYFAEGWNLPLIECMSIGMPCIATNYSGPTEYINDDNCVLLNKFKMEVASDGVFFGSKEAMWAVPDETELINAILQGIDQKTITISKNLEKFCDKWRWENAARIMLTRINKIEL